MKTRILVIAISALVLTGCPPTPRWSGRYHVVNNTGSTIPTLTVSVGNGVGKTWNQTAPGQGWIHPNLGGTEFLIVTWDDDSGHHQDKFSFVNKVGPGSKADVYVELKPGGTLAWRIVKRPAEEGSIAAAFAVVLIYLMYCVVACLLVGVPLGVGSAIAYAMFKGLTTGLNATIQASHGGRTAFQFTIREVFLLTTSIALALGWIVTIFRK